MKYPTILCLLLVLITARLTKAKQPPPNNNTNQTQPTEVPECTAELQIDLNDCPGNTTRKLEKYNALPICHDNTNPICRVKRRFFVTDAKPFSTILVPRFFMGEIFPLCCSCKSKFYNGTGLRSNKETGNVRYYNNNTEMFGDYRNITKDVGIFDIILPIFGSTSATKLYGLPFTPMFEMSEAVFMTNHLTSEERLAKLLLGLYTLVPLLLICLLLSFIAGAVGWLLETRKNTDEFSRVFHEGIFDGFWWSFVSMTTVGYGDKAPKSLSGRIFSVIWILAGITICSMLTASLTSVVTDAADSTPKTLESGDKVGVLNHRMFEVSLAIEKGAIPVKFDSVDDMLKEMKKPTEEIGIAGILVDPYLRSLDPNRWTSFQKSTVVWQSSSVSYGALFSSDADQNFFGEAIKDNRLAMKSCLMYSGLMLASDLTSEDSSNGLLSFENELFIPFLAVCLGVVLFVCILGTGHECMNKLKKKMKIDSEVDLRKQDGDTNQMKVDVPNSTRKDKDEIKANVTPFF
ncbi:uncharacterized protein [Clytia hemisphaerica]|uniref:Potassium channel domain-containing protein n=1 Tax=Clytia hemisphaerica TaxID=252671 RepID=A0A7M5VBZ2_9CNID